MRVFVTGGAGYIGSVIVSRLTARGHDVVVYDDLSRGHAASVPEGVPLVRGDVRDAAAVRDALVEGGCEAVVHMAALAEVAESVAEPDRYFSVNVDGTAAVVEAAAAAGAGRLVFSSTAAVYGAPRADADRRGPTRSAPANPYGETKLAGERLLQQAAVARRARRHRPALLQRLRRPRRLRRGSRPRVHLIPLALRARARRFADPRVRRLTTPRRTAPACATTCTSPTSPTRTSPRSRPCRASRLVQPGDGDAVTRCRRCSTPSRPSPACLCGERLRRAAPATRPSSSRATTGGDGARLASAAEPHGRRRRRVGVDERAPGRVRGALGRTLRGRRGRRQAAVSRRPPALGPATRG